MLLAALVLLGGRLVQLQGLAGSAYASQAEQQRRQVTRLPAERGQVLDSGGNVLAMSEDARAVYGEPRTIAQAAKTCKPGSAVACTPAAVAERLAPLLHLDVATLTDRLSSGRSFVYLARGLAPAVATAVRGEKLPGIGVLPESKRVHPGAQLAASVVGFTDADGKGLVGVENSWQSTLAGVDGKAVAERDNKGRAIPTGGDHTVEPVPGRSLQLTLDRDLQWYAEQQIGAEVTATGAKNGTAIVMDVRTGQVLAMASAPSFNPDDRTGVAPAAMTNPAVQEVYEPGSVNKVITAAAALQAGVVTPDSVVEVPSTYQVGRHTVHDAERHGLERLTFTGVLAKSSNIGTVKVAQQLGAQRLYDMLRAFGFGAKSGVGLPGEGAGIIPAPADWSGTSIATIPIGQGIAVDAMQVASVYATVANGGVRVTPSIVKGTVDAAGHLTPAPAPTTRRVVSAAVAAQLRSMLEAVISDQGTAPLAAIPGYRVAGKTGTAQRVVGGRYDGSYTSSFVGFAPADNPRLVTAVVLQGTGAKGYFGGAVAAPVFSSVTGFALRSLGIAPTGTRPPVLRLVAP